MENMHYLLMKAHTLMQRRILSEAHQIGLTPGQPKVLECLWEQEGLDQKTIAAHCEIEPATLGSILLRMEQSGLIERRQKEGNRRSLFVYLTEQGRDAASQMKSIFRNADQLAAEGLSEAEKETLMRLLSTVCSSLGSENPAE